MSNESSIVSFRADDELKSRLEKDHFNASSLIRELLENYFRTGDSVEVALRRRLKDKETELEDKKLQKTKLENDIDRLEREVSEIQTKIEERQHATPEAVVEFAEKLNRGDFTEEQLDPDNPAVKTWAKKAGMNPEKFIREVEVTA